jgi:hypothetical protein
MKSGRVHVSWNVGLCVNCLGIFIPRWYEEYSVVSHDSFPVKTRTMAWAYCTRIRNSNLYSAKLTYLLIKCI